MASSDRQALILATLEPNRKYWEGIVLSNARSEPAATKQFSPISLFLAVAALRASKTHIRQNLPRFVQEFWETPNFSVGFAD